MFFAVDSRNFPIARTVRNALFSLLFLTAILNISIFIIIALQ